MFAGHSQFVRRGRAACLRGGHERPKVFPGPVLRRPVTGPFWRERLEIVLSAHHPEPARKARGGRHPRFAEAAETCSAAAIPRNSHGFTMQVFWDSDVGKWIEAASYALAASARP